MDLDKSYASLFELMWYSQMPCFDILNVTSKQNQRHGLLNMTRNQIYGFN